MDKEWTFDLEYEGKPCGMAHVSQKGLYMTVDCDCSPVTDKIVRVYLPTSGEPCCLGVLAPEDRRLRLKRQFPVSRFPKPPFETAVVSQTGELWSPWSGETGGVQITGALAKKEGGARMIALPWTAGEPFPWMPLALRCTPRKIGDKQYLTLPAEEEPHTA